MSTSITVSMFNSKRNDLLWSKACLLPSQVKLDFMFRASLSQTFFSSLLQSSKGAKGFFIKVLGKLCFPSSPYPLILNVDPNLWVPFFHSYFWKSCDCHDIYYDSWSLRLSNLLIDKPEAILSNRFRHLDIWWS